MNIFKNKDIFIADSVYSKSFKKIPLVASVFKVEPNA